MIIDRTQADVNNAISIRENKIQKFETLTDKELEIIERGFFTITTLNRIEDKQAQLATLLTDMGYLQTPIVNKAWNNTQVFDQVEFQRIINNTNVLRQAFFVYKDTPNTPPVSFYWEDVNALENILYLLQQAIDATKASFVYVGNEYSLGGI